MTARYVFAVAAYWTAVAAVSLAATWAASLLPIADPIAAACMPIVGGSIGYLAADAWLPCPCQRKDHR